MISSEIDGGKKENIPDIDLDLSISQKVITTDRDPPLTTSEDAISVTEIPSFTSKSAVCDVDLKRD